MRSRLIERKKRVRAAGFAVTFPALAIPRGIPRKPILEKASKQNRLDAFLLPYILWESWAYSSCPSSALISGTDLPSLRSWRMRALRARLSSRR